MPVRSGKKTARATTRALLSIFLTLLVTISNSFLLPSYAVESGPATADGKIGFTLGEIRSSAGESKRDIVSAVSGEPLSAQRIKEILDRLPPLSPPEKKEFVIPEQSIVKPEIPGIQVEEPFPPKDTNHVQSSKQTAVRARGPLRITRISHEGCQEDVEQLSISFSEPMVPIGEAKLVDVRKVVSISPMPEGSFRWVGTQTLVFDPAKGRLPKATKYEIRVPASAASISGARLESDRVWTLETAPVNVVLQTDQGLSNPNYRQPVFEAAFNQDIDASEILKSVSIAVRISGRKKIYPVKQLTPAQAAGYASGKRFASESVSRAFDKKRNLLFAPVDPLPADVIAEVEFASHLPSLEGPLRSERAYTFPVSINGEFKLVDEPKYFESLGWTASVTEHRLQFTNPVAQEKGQVGPAQVRITPLVPHLNVYGYGNSLILSGYFRPLTRYTVTVDGSVKDIFGQCLGADTTVSFTTGAFRPSFSNSHRLVTFPVGKETKYKILAKAMPLVKISIYRVEPEQWFDYEPLVCRGQKINFPTAPVSTRFLPVGDEEKVLEIDLKPFLKDGLGHFVIVADPSGAVPPAEALTATWVQVTGLGLDAFAGKKLHVLTTSLTEGQPLDNTSLTLLPGRNTAQSDQLGQAQLPISDASASAVLVARRNGDSAILPHALGFSSWVYKPSPVVSKWHVVTDRQLYKPGETVKVRGWLRKFSLSEKTEAIELANYPSGTIYYKLIGLDEAELGTGQVELDAEGNFVVSTALPKKMNLGQVFVLLSMKPFPLADSEEGSVRSVFRNFGSELGSYHVCTIQVHEFRAPEFEMQVSTAASTIKLSESTTLTAATKYFDGGSLPYAPVEWTVTASPTSFSVPNFSDFSFGTGRAQSLSRTYKTKTDIFGKSSVKLQTESLDCPGPISYSCQATVTDVNRQTWSGSTHLLAHPSDYYVGLKAKPGLHFDGEPIAVDVIVTDTTGHVQPGVKIDLTVTGFNQTKREFAITRKSLTSGTKAQTINIAPGECSHIKISATIFDTKNRKNASLLQVWTEPKKEQPAQTKAASGGPTLRADKGEYQPGETARVTVVSQYQPKSGMMFLRRANIIESRPLTFRDKALTVEIPITEDQYPNLTLEVYLVGDDCQFGHSSLDLKVPALSRSLTLKAEPHEKETRPGADTSIDVEVKDSEGHPASNARVALAVVDEAVLALFPYSWSDPLATFYAHLYSAEDTTLGRSFILDPASVRQEMPPVVNGTVELEEFRPTRDFNLFQVESTSIDERYHTSGRAERHQSISPAEFSLRKQFLTLALFEPSVITDGEGKAKVKLHLPGNLTTYRIFAIASQGRDRFGKSESTIRTSQRLSIKASPPRFLNFGDSCELPVVLQNQTDSAMKVELVMRAQNAQVGSCGELLNIPPRNRVEVRFPVKTIEEGTASFQCVALADGLSDACEFSLPVMMPATTETFATYGQIDKGSVLQKLDCPKDIFKQVGGLTISTSSTALQSLTDAYIYLRDYPFMCSEQLSSRLIALLSLQGVLTDFGVLKGVEREKYTNRIQADIEILQGRQNPDGGFGLWVAGETNEWPYVSIQVARALQLALTKDYRVDDDKLSLAKGYLRNIEAHIDPRRYSEEARLSIKARALNVLKLCGDRDAAGARALLSSAIVRQRHSLPEGADTSLDRIPVGKLSRILPVECAAWLLSVFAQDEQYKGETELLRRLIESQIEETASTASTNATGYGDYDYCLFSSPRRTDAVVLDALMDVAPDSPLIPKLVKGLLAHRKKGLWDGTQENGYILQALDKYFETYEKQTPNMKVNSWLDSTLLASQSFVGRTTENRTVTVPTQYLLEHGGKDIQIDKDGPGRLYYRIALDYAPINLHLPPASFGFTVDRSYEAIDNSTDVRKDAEGTWHIKSGATVRTRLHMTVPGLRHHVALTDPLPAGAEPVNPELSGNRALPPAQVGEVRRSRHWRGPQTESPFRFESSGRASWSYWFEHQNLRDHQAEAFSSLLTAGSYEYSYISRATTPGDYIVPPAKAQEMYSSETFGRSGSEHVIIE